MKRPSITAPHSERCIGRHYFCDVKLPPIQDLETGATVFFMAMVSYRQGTKASACKSPFVLSNHWPSLIPDTVARMNSIRAEDNCAYIVLESLTTSRNIVFCRGDKLLFLVFSFNPNHLIWPKMTSQCRTPISCDWVKIAKLSFLQILFERAKSAGLQRLWADTVICIRWKPLCH